VTTNVCEKLARKAPAVGVEMSLAAVIRCDDGRQRSIRG